MILTTLLERNRENNPVYTTTSGNLSNHLSMALIALNKLGATDEQLVFFAKKYSPRLEPKANMKNKVIIKENNWRDFLGNNEYYPNYILYFKNCISILGIEKTIANHISKLLEGISEFHGLIRLAYAIESRDGQEVAVALAYFSAFYNTYNKTTDYNSHFSTPTQGLEFIRQNEYFSDKKFTGKNIHERLNKIINLPGFISTVRNLKFNQNSLIEFADLLIRLYTVTNDFVVLHALTSTHALRLVWPYIKNDLQCLYHYWQIVCAVYIYAGTPLLPNSATLKVKYSEAFSWDNICAKVISETDVHVIKLVYSSFEEYKVYQNSLYNYIAAKAVKLA